MDIGFTVPTYTQIRDRITADVEAGGNARMKLEVRLRATKTWVYARVWAGLSVLLFKFVAFLGEMLLPDMARGSWLARWGALFGLTRDPAVAFAGTFTCTGTPGAVIPINTLWQNADGLLYRCLGATVIPGGGVAFPAAQASYADLTDATGADWNMAIGTSVELQSPVAGVDAAASVATVTATGEDEEDDDSYRERILYRLSNPPQGGAESDYVLWMQEVAGVGLAWIDDNAAGPGTVYGYFVLSAYDDLAMIPGALDVAAVQTAVDLVRPVCAEFTAVAPAAVTVAAGGILEIELDDDTTANRNAVYAELRSLFLREGGRERTVSNADIRAAITAAAGAHILHDVNDTGADSDLPQAAGEILILDGDAVAGDITWI